MRNVLVTGCAKSGTLALMKALNGAGVVTRHECIYGRDTIASEPSGMVWPDDSHGVVEVSWLAVPFLSAGCTPRNVPMFLLVRSPKSQAVSMADFALSQDHWWAGFARSMSGAPASLPSIGQALWYYVYWNEWAMRSDLFSPSRVLLTDRIEENVVRVARECGVEVSAEKARGACAFDHREHVHGVRDRGRDEVIWSEPFEGRELLESRAFELYAKLRSMALRWH